MSFQEAISLLHTSVSLPVNCTCDFCSSVSDTMQLSQHWMIKLSKTPTGTQKLLYTRHLWGANGQSHKSFIYITVLFLSLQKYTTTIIFFVMTTSNFSIGFFNMISSQSLRKGKSSALEKTICMCQCLDNIRRKWNHYWGTRANTENVRAFKKRR